MKRIVITATVALVLVSTAAARGPVTGKVRGIFVRGPYDGTIDQAGLKRYIKTSHVWCGWQDGKVLVHVQMKNTAAEHVTVNWYPRYAIRRGGVHGDGFSAVESSGFDSGGTRGLKIRRSVKGVKKKTPIAWCRPHFQMIESG